MKNEEQLVEEIVKAFGQELGEVSRKALMAGSAALCIAASKTGNGDLSRVFARVVSHYDQAR